MLLLVQSVHVFQSVSGCMCLLSRNQLILKPMTKYSHFRHSRHSLLIHSIAILINTTTTTQILLIVVKSNANDLYTFCTPLNSIPTVFCLSYISIPITTSNTHPNIHPNIPSSIPI